jgi:apolipoprotein N-acyltransferase
MEGLYFLAAIASALLISASFPPVSLAFISFFALIPLLWALHRVRKKHWSKPVLIAGTFGLFHMAIFHSWMLELTRFAPMWGVIGLFSLASILFAAYYALIGAIYSYCCRFFHWPVAITVAWCLGEFLRSFGPLSSTGGSLGYVLTDFPMVLQLAEIGGLPLLTLILLLININLYALLKSRQRVAALTGLIAFHLLVLAWILSPKTPYEGDVPVSIIQPNHDQKYKMEIRNRGAIRADIIALFEGEAKSDHNPQVVLAPETITAWLNLESFYFTRELDRISSTYDSTFIFGSPTSEGSHYFNSVISIWSDNGSLQRHYQSKTRLMPFGEYWPMKSVFKWLNLGSVTDGADYSPGTTITPLEMKGNNNAAALICLETTYPSLARHMVSKGADILLVLANNAWFFDSSAAAKLLQFSQVRAVENRRWLLQSANTGISAVISPDGRVVESLPINSRGILHARIEYITKLTIYNRFGDILIYGMVLLVLTAQIRVLFLARNPR